MCRLTFTLLIAALVLFAASLLYTEAAGTQIRKHPVSQFYPGRWLR